ncbi:hypothetical protein IFM89_001948, partial [Coptis chinensis]
RNFKSFQMSDGDPFDGNDLLDYSSCGESEFDKYCSANSVMGTPSLCSSVGTLNDFLDLDLGSVKSLGVGKCYGDKSVSTSGGHDCLDVDLGNENCVEKMRNENCSKSLLSCEDNSDSSISLKGGDRFERQQSSTIDFSHTDGSKSKALKLSRVQNGSNSFNFASRDDNKGLSTEMGTEFHSLFRSCDSPIGTNDCESDSSKQVNYFDPFHATEIESPEEEGMSSGYENSDEDGSMFNSGTDDERRMDAYNIKNLHYLQESKSRNENPLFIDSAVAFGADDWDDFMQGAEGKSLFPLLDKPTDWQRENLETEGKLVNSVSLFPVSGISEQAEIVRNVPVTTSLANHKEHPESYSSRDSWARGRDFFAEKSSLNINFDIKDNAAETVLQFISNDEVIANNPPENESVRKSKQSDSLSEVQHSEPRGKQAVLFEDLEVHDLPPTLEDEKAISYCSPASVDNSENHLAQIKPAASNVATSAPRNSECSALVAWKSPVGNSKSKESCDELVLEMEEILLDSVETHGARFPQSNRSPQPFRDGSSTASTSGANDTYPRLQHPFKIDGVEVVGAKQKKGDVSLGERLVGVKEYSVYVLRVWSGKDQWEVERRYRDFFTLYRQLRTLYANHGLSLPSPWSRVEQESRKFFGNASPNVVSERSALIQECLKSILQSSTPNIAPGTLNWFLYPQKALSSSSLLNTRVPQSTSAFTGGICAEDVPTFGKTISLLVDIQPHKPVKQLLEAQQYICAGCHKCLDTEKSLMREFVQTLGWGKPRLCEYSGQLFCASCHTNETAVLPAKVLHFWDFSQYPVSQLAKSFLDSIYDQPMLCVSAVNPFLFSKVPALHHVMGIRKKIGAMVPYVRCPFRKSVQRGVGSRKYLLEGNDFFALRDLVDLSKGAFAALPIVVETVSTKILEHITQQCLVCCDVGIPCGARHACKDPSSLIFPFQEDEVERCRYCKVVFHKPCFSNLSHCPCGGALKVVGGAGPAQDVKHVLNKSEEGLDALARKPDSGSPMKFLSHLFSKKRQEKVLGCRNSNHVILMGSLPSSFAEPL